MIRANCPISFGKITQFLHLSSDVLNALAQIARMYSLKSGDVLLYQNDLIQSFYCIQEGGVRLVDYTEEGQCVSLKIYGPGDLFGLLAISGSYPHPAQIEAIHDTVIIAVDGQEARKLMLIYPQLALTVLDLLTKHVHEAHGRLRHMAAEKVDRRLARALLHLCSKFGEMNGDSISLNVPISQRDLAQFTGTTVETINRTLTLWAKQGLVACSHKHIDILNRNALVDIAENQTVADSKPA